MHWTVDPSTLYFGSPACALPTHNRSTAKHETLPVSAKIFMRLCFIDFLPVWFDIAHASPPRMRSPDRGKQSMMMTRKVAKRQSRPPLAAKYNGGCPARPRRG